MRRAVEDALAEVDDRQASSSYLSGDHMDYEILTLNFGYAIFGVVLMWLSYRLFDRLTPEVNFPEELKKGNIAVAIFIGALFISIALVVGNALN